MASLSSTIPEEPCAPLVRTRRLTSNNKTKLARKLHKRSKGKKNFRKQCKQKSSRQALHNTLFDSEAACDDGSDDEMIDSEPDTEDDGFIDDSPTPATSIPFVQPDALSPGTTTIVPNWGDKETMSPKDYWMGPRLTGKQQRGNRGPFERSKHFLFTFPGRKPGEEIRLPDCIEWAKLVAGDRYQSAIAAHEIAPTTKIPHFHIYVQLTATGPPVRCYKGEVSLFGKHGDVRGGYTERTDWVRTYCGKDGTFITDGIAIETYLEARKMKKSEVLLNIINQGFFREEDLRQFPALLERTSNLHDGLLALKQMRAAERFHAAWRAPDHFFAWQRDLLDSLKDAPSDRCVKWIVDLEGNRGKSRISTMLQNVAGAALFTDFNKNNIVFAYECQPVVVLDLPKCSDCEDPRLYALIEGFINGMLFNHKYRSKQLLFTRPHVIVFSNEEPNRARLSADRWGELKILGDKSRGPFMPRGDMELVTYDWGWLSSGTGKGHGSYPQSESVPVAYRNIVAAKTTIGGPAQTIEHDVSAPLRPTQPQPGRQMSTVLGGRPHTFDDAGHIISPGVDIGSSSGTSSSIPYDDSVANLRTQREG